MCNLLAIATCSHGFRPGLGFVPLVMLVHANVTPPDNVWPTFKYEQMHLQISLGSNVSALVSYNKTMAIQLKM